MSFLERKENNDMNIEELLKKYLENLNYNKNTIDSFFDNLSEERKRELLNSLEPNIDFEQLIDSLEDYNGVVPKSFILDKDRERILRSQIEKKKDV